MMCYVLCAVCYVLCAMCYELCAMCCCRSFYLYVNFNVLVVAAVVVATCISFTLWYGPISFTVVHP